MIKNRFNKQLKLKGSATVGILSGVCILIAIGLLFFTWYMILPKIKDSQQKVAVANADVKELNTRIQEISKAKTVLNRIEPSLPRFDIALPLTAEYPELITTLATSADSSEMLSKPAVQISTAQDTSYGYDSIAISVTGLSYYPNFINFMNKMFTNLRIIKISSITIMPSEDEDSPAGAIDFAISAEAYAKNDGKSATTTTTPNTTNTNQGAVSTFKQITSQ